ncbi:MAG: Y-family DNA polymerase [Elusimicrobiota bacterium]
MIPDHPSRLVGWLYLDMNSFFASVEQELNPVLRGKPVAVVPLMADTTCCIAVSYEGKAFGVKTGTKVGEARKLCPQMQFIDGDHANYVKFHNKIVEAVDSCLPIESICSIDEIACRLTGSQQDLEAARALAAKIKSAIKDKVGSSLKCSIGLAPNRYLAKIAADMKKPDGFTVILPRDLPKILYQLRLRDLPGVGQKLESRLSGKNIHDLETLCSMGPKEMRQAWGSVHGEEMWRLLRGEDLPEKSSEQKSISHSHVLPPNLRHNPGASRILKKLTVKAAARLRQEGFFASGIQLFVDFIGRNGWKARCGLLETQDTSAFIRALGSLLGTIPSGSIYAVGVALTGLVPEALHAPSLFEDPYRNRLMKTLDDLNRKFGKDAVHYGAIHESEELAPLRIAFTRIPAE